MRVAISGASGLVGSALMPVLTSAGHEVWRMVRPGGRRAPGSIAWDPEAGSLDLAALEGINAVVHLAGESIASRWTDERKRRIRESRVQGTRLVAESIARLAPTPSVLVCASAVGIYGPRRAEPLDETAAPGTGFLAEVCRAWEGAADPARAAGIRVVHTRFGVILSDKGGALPKMLTPFKLGVGGKVGPGDQYMSWITLDDVVGVIRDALGTTALSGPVNTVAPTPVTNLQFTKTLGRVLSRPTVLPMPALAARLVFGEMAQELLLSGQRAVPARLLALGFRFRHPELEAALRSILRR
jgi:uncharacterized protein (TIGR01777 family)